ncbi:MAG: hypothetical protein GC151_14700 [Betaproteobacteria bacterium]|nr:hypothetical protein [Betaproteobacteria bacterium]
MRKSLFVVAAMAAMQLSCAFAADGEVIARARVAFGEQVKLSCSRNVEPAWIAPEAVYRYRLNDTSELHVEGRRGVIAHLCALKEVGRSTAAENVRFFPTLEADTVFVQYDLVPVGGPATSSRMLAIIEMRGDRIAGFTQLNRSPESLEALELLNAGTNGRVPGEAK